MEYNNETLTFDRSKKPNTGLCRRRHTCTSSKLINLQENSITKTVSRTWRFVTPRTFLQRIHFHEPWRDSVVLVIFLMLIGSLQMTMAQAYLPSYSEYTSTFEWINPDSLDPDGLNVCLNER